MWALEALFKKNAAVQTEGQGKDSDAGNTALAASVGKGRERKKVLKNPVKFTLTDRKPTFSIGSYGSLLLQLRTESLMFYKAFSSKRRGGHAES